MKLLYSFLEGAILGAIAGVVIDLVFPETKTDPVTWWSFFIALFIVFVFVYRVIVARLFSK